MVPALPVPDATATLHVTVVGLKPVTVALNCCELPIVTFPPAARPRCSRSLRSQSQQP